MDAAIQNLSLGRDANSVITKAALRRGFAIAIAALLVVAAMVLVARRIAGALAEPLPAGALIATGIILIAAAASVRTLSRQTTVGVLASVALVLIAFSVSLPGSSWVGLMMLWLGVIGEEVWAWKPRRANSTNQIDVAWRHAEVDLPKDANREDHTIAGGQPPSGDVRADIAHWPSSEGSLPLATDNEHEPLSDWTNSTATQQLRYSRRLEGSMSVEGWLRAEFASGQRTAIVHVAFCPAFSGPPQVEAEPLDGPDCDIRATLTLPWGIRWEVKLDRAAKEPDSVVLGFVAAET